MRLEDLLKGEAGLFKRRPHNRQAFHPPKDVLKLEDFLLEDSNREKCNLEQQVLKLRGELEDEQSLNKALRAALRGPVLSQPRLSLLLLPPQVQGLIEELATAEAEIICLEKKVEDLKLGVYEERKAKEERKANAKSRRKSLRRLNHLPGKTCTNDLQATSASENFEELEKENLKNLRRVSTGSTTEFLRMNPPMFEDEPFESKKMHTERNRRVTTVLKESVYGKANEASVELIECLIEMYLKLNKASRDKEGSITIPNLSLQFTKSSSFNRSRPTLHPYNHHASNLDPYGVLSNSDTTATVRDIGTYKKFIHITRSSIDVSRLSDCSTELVKLRDKIEKLQDVDLSILTYKQKLAFWINIYNGCVMNAFLEHGLPSSQMKLLALTRKASLNIGGRLVRAVDIENHILQIQGGNQMVKTEMVLRNKYGPRRSESNVTFALCRGTWSSPALRIYTADEIFEDLERAKAEYLAASIGVSSKGKILVPELLRSHLRGFGDNVQSILEWLNHQLPRGESIRNIVAENLHKKDQVPASKLVEMQPYEYEFRYLLPLG